MDILCKKIYKEDLYELKGKNLWIRDIVYKYNDYGFYTTRSQPGNKTIVLQYKSHQHRKDNNIDGLITTNRYQRAYINGYMHKDMAIFITESLIEHPYLFVRNEIDNKVFTDSCKLGSVTFKNDQPEINEMSDFNELDTQESFNLNLPLRRKLKDFNSFINNDSIIEFEIIDKRWDNNDELWTTLLHLIFKFHKV